MNVTAVVSAALATVAYDQAGHILQLKFRSGSVYRYFDVPAEMHDSLLRASSKGRYFNSEIRERFRHVHIVSAGEV